MKQLTKKELKERFFICTDSSKQTEQWVKKNSKTQFEVYERPANVIQDIDLNDYTEKEIREYISGYYDSLEELKKQCGEESNQVIAECISESTIIDSIVWNSMAQINIKPKTT
jgi:hypothetical protein